MEKEISKQNNDGKIFNPEKFKELLAKKKITANKFAKMTGIWPTTAYSWASGKGRPTEENIDKICKFFGVKEDYLFKDLEKDDNAKKENKNSEEDVLELLSKVSLKRDVKDFNVKVVKGEDIIKESRPDLRGKYSKKNPVEDTKVCEVASKQKYKDFNSTNANNIMERFEIINENILLLGNQLDKVVNDVFDISSVVKPKFSDPYESLNMQAKLKNVLSTVQEMDKKINHLASIIDDKQKKASKEDNMFKDIIKHINVLNKKIDDLSEKAQSDNKKDQITETTTGIKTRPLARINKDQDVRKKKEDIKKSPSTVISTESVSKNTETKKGKKEITEAEIKKICKGYKKISTFEQYENNIISMCKFIYNKTGRTVKQTLHECYISMRDIYCFVSVQAEKDYYAKFGTKSKSTIELIYYTTTDKFPIRELFYHVVANTLQSYCDLKF